MEEVARHFRSQGRWAARTMPARTIQPRRPDGAGGEGGFFLTQEQIVNMAAVGKMFPSKQATYIFWPLLLALDPS